MGASLIGAGAILLGTPCPASARELGRDWTGYGGVGDYQFSNGNTASVVQSAHRIRDGLYDGSLPHVIDTGESFDAVVVGAGFAGLSAIYEFTQRKPQGTCLVLDNHPIFGGEAKQNEFDVDGYRLVGPQGSNSFQVPKSSQDPTIPSAYRNAYQYWHQLGLPETYEFAKQAGGNTSVIFGKDNFDAMYSDSAATVGYFFQNELTHGQGVWINNIWADDLKRAPIADRLKSDLIAWRDYKGDFSPGARAKWGPWLDSMSIAEFASKVVGVKSDVARFADPGLAAGIFGATTDAISALATFGSGIYGDRESPPWLSFPGGNTTLLRHVVKAVFPDAIVGPKRFDAIANNPVNFAALDQAGSNLKMRLSSTVVRVTHDGEPANADYVTVVYEKGGKLFRVKAKGAVLAIGSWVAKHIATDLPSNYVEALTNIFHGPILSVNVALRNWRFMDKLGISAARWFDGFGFFANIRAPMLVGDRPTPFHPDKPAVLTFYVPFLKPGLPIQAQGPAGRSDLYGTSYAQYERMIVDHLRRLFGSSGFDARRDVAGIVLNRWGHALHSPQPGFYFGKDGKPAPFSVLRNRFSRIAFGHSETSGLSQSWESATEEGKRAISQILETI
jgi:spermidine dehydrogenase